MLQAVKGNEGGYSALLLRNHPNTHVRINEGAGGRLISLFCVAVGARGAGHSGLKAARNSISDLAAVAGRLLGHTFTFRPVTGWSRVGSRCPGHG